MFGKVKRFISSKISRVSVTVATAVVALTITALAEATPDPALVSSMTSAVDSIKGNTMGMLSLVLPAAIAILGISLAIGWGMKLYKKLAK